MKNGWRPKEKKERGWPCATRRCRKPTNLRDADFWMADLKDANLQGADLQGANLSDVTNLTQKQIDSAITDARTVLPAGLRRG
jgi:uncharacterized protein YjbI with pentapeptide repeats